MKQDNSIHASAVLVGARAVLIRGPSGSGKSRLAVALIHGGGSDALAFTRLVGDDRVHLEALHGRLLVRPAETLAGLLEVRRLGIRRVPFEAPRDDRRDRALPARRRESAGERARASAEPPVRRAQADQPRQRQARRARRLLDVRPPLLRQGLRLLLRVLPLERAQVDGHYWFPVYTKGEGVLHFAGGHGYLSDDVHIRDVIKYTDYKQFGSTMKIVSVDGEQQKDKGQQNQQPKSPK